MILFLAFVALLTAIFCLLSFFPLTHFPLSPKSSSPVTTMAETGGNIPEKNFPRTDSRVLDEDGNPVRAIAFPPDEVIHEEHEKHGHGHDFRSGAVRPKGVEMKRELTQEDKALAAAGYEQLEEQKAKEKKEFDKVDISEHKLPFRAFKKALEADFDTKSPGESHGLTEAEAKARLARDGKNVLTPPKKKSALRKVRNFSKR